MGVFVSLPLVGEDGSPVSKTVVKNSSYFKDIRSLTAAELVDFPTGLSVIESQIYKGLQEGVHVYVSSSTVAAVQAAVNSPVAGVASVGQVALVAGTLAITIPGLTTSNRGFVSLVASATGSSTVTYQAVCTANTLTLRANVAAGTINVADVSTVNYFVL